MYGIEREVRHDLWTPAGRRAGYRALSQALRCAARLQAATGKPHRVYREPVRAGRDEYRLTIQPPMETPHAR